MNIFQLSIIGGYFLILFGVGIYATRFIDDTTDFLLAGRRLGIVLATGALTATHFGGGFVMGTGEWGFDHGLTGIAYAVGVALSFLFLAFVSARKMRRLSMFTVPDYLEKRYQSKVVRALGAVLSLVAIIGIIGSQVWASQGALGILGIDETYAAIIATLLFIVYTAASGLWGVTLTDALQLVIIFIGVPAAGIAGIMEAGGFSGVREGVAALELGMTADAYFHPLGAGAAMVLAAIVPTIMYTLIGQDFYQRLFAAKDENTSFWAAILSGVILSAFAIFPTLTGMASRSIFGDEIAAAEAVPMLITEVLPLGIGTLIVAAIIGAIMSTADSLLVAGTSHITHDIYAELINQDIEENSKKMLFISRLWTVILGLLALFMALTFEAIIGLLLMSYTLYSAGVFIPVVLGLYWKRGNATGAILGIVAGSTAGVAGELGWIDFGGVPVIVAGALVSLVLYVVGSLLTEPPAELPEEVV
ncbi:sodium:solute symporter family protein [Halarsenatibacter silvermanii]|uniref:Solute:Na+ symporter, SSS family n=1 Tax=Halarsenatibacter silvermanii TaxID=321763 RepID=A0A1G9KML7_9FIRM|nr:sodium:solute symporter family protein [Halarsenatibacter silvermanii]SDL50836.1 solute:Na+ symporter, SSS family [Halarsenatibacter silvermanii]